MKLVVGALSGWKHHDRRERCLTTWMHDFAELNVQAVFLLGCPTLEKPELAGSHYLCLPCADDYPSLPQRTRAFCRWALQQPDWDYLFKCDDDTYVSVPRLAAYDPVGREYVGAEWQLQAGYGSGGAGYFLSRKAAALVAERLNQGSGAEDLLVGQVLRSAGITLTIEPRLVPWGSMQHRPKKNNDLITLHGVDAETFLAAHAETSLHSTAP